MPRISLLLVFVLLVTASIAEGQTSGQDFFNRVVKSNQHSSNRPRQHHLNKPAKYDSNDPATWPDELDAMVAAPQNHKVVLENERVRVLEVTVQPGEREPVHGHKWPSVMHVMAEDLIRDYDRDGNLLYDSRTDQARMKAPCTIWMPPQAPHSVENLGKAPVRLLRVELKQ